MKKKFFILLLIFINISLFGQDTEEVYFMLEMGSGYNIGINMDSSVPLEFRMIMPIVNFGFLLSGGIDYATNNGWQLFIGGTYFAISKENMRLPISIGFSYSENNKNSYLGIGGIVSYHFVFSRYLYLGFGLALNYNFRNLYNEIVGNGKGLPQNGIDNKGNTITTFPTPKTEIINHWGDYINIRPTISIGYQLK